MEERDLILDGTHTPGFEEIRAYFRPHAVALWNEINAFLQESYQVKPQTAFSKCSGKPGWNVKYQKSGKSLCTLYPERDGFIALVVVTLDLDAVIESLQDGLAKVREVARSARPFNGTKWLMIPVYDAAVLQEVQQLLFMKQAPRK